RAEVLTERRRRRRRRRAVLMELHCARHHALCSSAFPKSRRASRAERRGGVPVGGVAMLDGVETVVFGPPWPGPSRSAIVARLCRCLHCEASYARTAHGADEGGRGRGDELVGVKLGCERS